MSKDFKQQGREFISALEKLNAGELAILRRSGNDYYDNPRALPVFAKIGALESKVKSLIAVLFSVYHRDGEKALQLEHYNFGQSYYRAVKGDGPDFKEEDYDRRDKRFKAIIASDFEQIPFRLRQLVKFIKANDGQIDFQALLSDLYSWSAENRWVQRKWVKGFYNIQNNYKNEKEGVENE